MNKSNNQNDIYGDLEQFEEFIKTNKRSQMHKIDIVKWLQSRTQTKNNNSKVQKNYLLYPQQLVDEFRIKKIFTVFDEDMSDAIDINEMVNMFREYDIPITFEQLKRMYDVLQVKTLSFKAFKQCATSEQTNKVFTLIMKEVEQFVNIQYDLNDQKKKQKEFKRQEKRKETYRILKENNQLDLLSEKLQQQNKNDTEESQNYNKRRSTIRKPVIYDKENPIFLPSNFKSMIKYISYRINREKKLEILKDLERKKQNIEKMDIYKDLLMMDNLNDEQQIQQNQDYIKQKQNSQETTQKLLEQQLKLTQQLSKNSQNSKQKDPKKIKISYFNDQKELLQINNKKNRYQIENLSDSDESQNNYHQISPLRNNSVNNSNKKYIEELSYSKKKDLDNLIKQASDKGKQKAQNIFSKSYIKNQNFKVKNNMIPT